MNNTTLSMNVRSENPRNTLATCATVVLKLGEASVFGPVVPHTQSKELQPHHATPSASTCATVMPINVFDKRCMPNIKLQSSDGEVFDIDVEVAKCSVTIKTMLEDLGMDDDEEEIVPLPNVNSAILKKVIQWATFHKDDPPPPEDDENKEKRTDDISSWDADFLKVDQGTLFELILAANYLDIKGLLDVTCKTVANMIKGKTPEEIRKTFNIKNDFTATEEEQVRKENEWCEEK
uniref:S-phase kinase-associated protein 1 n=1 Tax=Timema bartmani TaxID=61472 RepID=A0A7R9EQK1_9NEOP|nr:unnamed protein product [Timema bartmani]